MFECVLYIYAFIITEVNIELKKLPIGIQGFEKLRTDGFLYIDKTSYIYELVHNNVPYFLRV
ncbi:AAA family ATPase [Butyrivibrio fibrisolvens]|uniref:AAA family ATPase n=1 Tax=Butyrivibrio fibrisolvens TaxID=831 RepID=UPI002FE5DEB6